ncbi:carbonic anhydrase family protein [Planotetraspora silvatica]|nr:carbonic anhydrase family protein [Planotetraspora silvatica]
MLPRFAVLSAAAVIGLTPLVIPAHATAHRPPCGRAGTDAAVQSPVEIDRATACRRAVPRLVIHYPPNVDGKILFQDRAPIGGRLSEHDDIRFVVEDERARPYITLGGERYDLSNVHFHGHAEHKFAGEPFAPVEAHLVHEKTSGERGYAVLSVLLDQRNDGRPSEHDRLLTSPPALGMSRDVRNIHLWDLLPIGRTTFRYTGSLTTPDEEGTYFQPVNWVVFGQRAKAGREGIRTFRSLWPTGEGNSRELQPNFPPPTISTH